MLELPSQSRQNIFSDTLQRQVVMTCELGSNEPLNDGYTMQHVCTLHTQRTPVQTQKHFLPLLAVIHQLALEEGEAPALELPKGGQSCKNMGT